MPKVSAVIPNYNHARFLRRRIDSVFAQTYQDFEVILMDDCSTDASRSIISSYANDPRVRIEFNEVNSGSTFKQWNKGVRLANGEYVWLAESDDYADPRFLERLVTVLDSTPDAAFAYCRSWRVSDDDQLDGFSDSCLSLCKTSRWTADYLVQGIEECKKHFIFQNIVLNASAVLFRTAAFRTIGGAQENLRLCGDWKLWATMALMGQVAYVSEPLNYYRFHDQSVRNLSKRSGADVEEIFYVIRWLSKQVNFSKAERDQVREKLSDMWVPYLITSQVPLSRRWLILGNVLGIRRLVSAVFAACRDWVRANFWHPLLNLTRPIRHALGLRQQNAKMLKK